jgi:uncharacterized protein (TIGR04255 family)
MTAWQDDLPTFDNPPVIETVLGVQFSPIPGFTSGHSGWYWKRFLDQPEHSWIKLIETAPLPDQFEKFGEQQSWKLPMLEWTASQASRLQIISADDDRVVQVQNTRFLYNWRKRESLYPSFKRICPEFLAKLAGFRDFLQVVGLGGILQNQWEVTYINHVPRGDLWTTQEDWQKILPGLYPVPIQTDEARFESAAIEWHYEIAPKRGRLHVSCQHGRIPQVGDEVLVLQLTARGTVDVDVPGWDLETGLELGHRVVVQTFVGLASQTALHHWGIK